MFSCALIVLNYNGKELLSKCLPSLIEAVKYTGENCKLVLVDNRSTDDSVLYVRQHFPSVEIIVSPKNDYLFSLNDVVKNRREDIVVILNNDIKVEPNFIKPLLPYFSQPDIFAVTCQLCEWDGGDMIKQNTGWLCFVQTKKGWYEDIYIKAPETPCFVQLASGAASAFRRSMFVELDGFDPLFHPGYCEDTDLSYRAWLCGWKIIYEPKSIVYHIGNISMDKKFGIKRKQQIALHNRILFVAKDCGEVKFLIRFLALYLKRMIQHLLFEDKALGQAMFAAIQRLPIALLKRFKNYRSCRPCFSEYEINGFMNKPSDVLNTPK